MWEIKGKDNQVKATINSLEYNGEWMGESYVTVTVESPAPVNFEIGDYIIYRDERFEINYDPGKIKSAPRYEKGDAFKYENIKFNSLADELTRCDFRDVVLQDNNLHFTSLPKFPFYGGVRDLANRIQANLDKLYTGANKWTVIVSPEFQDDKELNVQIDNIKVQGALEILVNQFETYYTISGRTITIGAAGIPAGHLFKYGKGNGLYEIEQNAEADQAIVTRLRAYGSTRNLPHRYYNSLSGVDGKKLIPDNMAVQYLMLPEFPYTTQDPYIDSPNIAKLGVREDSVFFDGSGELEEIYPSIEGMTAEQLKSAGVPCNSTGALDEIVSAEQMTDNGVGEINEGETQATVTPPTFKVTLKDLGFDIWEYRIAGTAPVISFKTGMLGGRDFKIVGCKKIELGGKVRGYELELNRVYDDGIKLWFPYSAYNAQAGDKFVLLYIEMPEVYIKAAAQRLKEAATEWLSKNDYSRSIYAPKVDEIFMARQHDAAMASGGKIKSLHDTLKEGMLLLFEDEDLNIDASIFIDRLTIKEEGVVPTYEVVLKEEKTVGRLDKMQNQIDSLVAGKGQGGGGYTAAQIRSMIEAYGDARFLSKLKDDRSQGQIASDKAIEVGDFLAGVSGAKIGKDAETGQTFGEMDRLFVRIKAYFETLTIINADSLAGEQRITPGGGVKCTKVEEVMNTSGRAYRCYFLSEQDGEKTETKIIAGDQAIAQMFNARTGTTNKVSNHRYWRLVTGVSNDARTDDSGNRYGYIDLSASDCEKDSDIPQEGDTIVQFGNRTDRTRQAAMVFSTVAANDTPSIKLFTGIGSGTTNAEHYSLAGRDIISYGYDSVKGHAYFRCYGDTYIGSPDGSTFVKYDREADALDIKARLTILPSSTIGDKTLEEYFSALIPEIKQEDIENFVNAIVDPKIEGIQNQIDGVIENWFANGAPALTNYPASDWATVADKEKHLGDLYFDNQTGLAYRFSKNADGTYFWNDKVDSATAKALAAAAKAQDTADGKRRVFTSQPTVNDEYDAGDLWVNANYGTTYKNDILRAISHKGKGEAFNIAHWTLASKYTDDSLAQEAMDSIADYEYLKKAMVGGASQTIGGLFLSSYIKLGSWDKANPDRPVFSTPWSGLNGVYNGGRTPSYFAGGDMIDRFDAGDNRLNVAGTRYATSMIRMDGSAYFANGSVGFRADGSGWFGSGNSIITFANGSMTFGSGVVLNASNVAGLTATLSSISNWQIGLQTLLAPCDADDKEISWVEATQEDAVNGGIKAKSVKARVGFWSESFISARGRSGSGGTSGGGSGYGLIRKWEDLTESNKTTSAVSAELSAGLRDRISNLESISGRYLLADGSNATASGMSAMIRRLGPASVNVTDSTLLVTSDAYGESSNPLYYRRPATALWGYVRGKTNPLYVKKAGDTMTGTLNVSQINEQSGANTLLAYKRALTGAGSTQWTVGAPDCQGVIRSSNSSLIHYRNGVGNSTVWDSGNDGPGSGLDADMLDGIQGANYGYAARIGNFMVGSSRADITTAQFITKLSSLGAFSRPQWTAKCSWYHAGNDNITDSGVGNIELAGAVIEVVSLRTDQYTIRVTTSPATANGGERNAVFIYRNHGSDYSPNWKRLANTSDNVASATKLQTARTINGTSFDGTADIVTSRWGTTRTLWGQVCNGSGNVSGNMAGVGSLSASGEIRTTAANAFRAVYGRYGFFIRNDGDRTFFMLTGSGDATGSYNSLRPFILNNSTGDINMGGSVLNIAHGGNVGMGTAPSASHRLDVNGNAMVRGTMYAGNGALTVPASGSITHGATVIPSSDNSLRLGSEARNYAGVHSRQLINNTDSVLWIWQAKNYQARIATAGQSRLTVTAAGGVIIGGAYEMDEDMPGVLRCTEGVYSDGFVSGRHSGTSSDARLKRITGRFGISVRDIARSPSVSFLWKKDGAPDVGSIAQYWHRIDPRLAPEGPGGSLVLQYGKTALLGLKSVACMAESHEDRLADQDRRIKVLERRIAIQRETIRNLKKTIGQPTCAEPETAPEPAPAMTDHKP